MNCPTCDSWSSVLETRDGEHGATKRRRECANGHRFSSVEIASISYTRARPSILRSIETIQARIGRWKRNAAIARDPRPTRDVALESGLHLSEVNKIRAAFRRRGAEAD